MQEKVADTTCRFGSLTEDTMAMIIELQKTWCLMGETEETAFLCIFSEELVLSVPWRHIQGILEEYFLLFTVIKSDQTHQAAFYLQVK